MRSGVSRQSVRSRRRCRMISWPAAKQIRWVKPSITTVSPSRTRAATASRMVVTLEPALKRSRSAGRRSWRAPCRCPPRRPRAAAPAGACSCPRPRSRRPRSNAPWTSCLDDLGRGLARGAVLHELHADHEARRRARRRCSGASRPGAARRPAAARPSLTALAMRPPSTRSSVASAAAQQTGLPPKVEPCEPLSHLVIDSLAMMRADRHAGAEPLGGEQDVGLDALVIAGPHLPRAARRPTAPRRPRAGCRTCRRWRAGRGASPAAGRRSRLRPESARRRWPRRRAGRDGGRRGPARSRRGSPRVHAGLSAHHWQR